MKVLKHFKTIMTHKKWVFYYACKVGIPWRGFKHDFSKFSPIEFWESVKYYQGNRSPIDACKEANGYSKAWLHHRGRNSHHYEYYVDNFDNGGQALIMPFLDTVELICDYLAAGRAYMKENFSYAAEYEWWKTKAKKPLLMHPAIKDFINCTLSYLAFREKCNLTPLDHFTKANLKEDYDACIRKWRRKNETNSIY